MRWSHTRRSERDYRGAPPAVQRAFDKQARYLVHDLHHLIENVGNLVCPSSYDLGENLRLVLLSVTEGEDKPLKYPTIFNSADVAVVTKIDLAAAVVEFDWGGALANIQAVRPNMQVLRVSAKTGEGLDEWQRFLQASAGTRPISPDSTLFSAPFQAF
jgi:hydrogenase accessory protein HypB